MLANINLQSNKHGELNRFLSKFYETNLEIENSTSWSKSYENPIEMVDIISAYIDNLDLFEINMWVSLDNNVFINVSEFNGNSIIKYLFERYPY